MDIFYPIDIPALTRCRWCNRLCRWKLHANKWRLHERGSFGSLHHCLEYTRAMERRRRSIQSKITAVEQAKLKEAVKFII